MKFTSLLSFCFFIHLTTAFYLSLEAQLDYSIQELNSTKSNDFLYEASLWQATHLITPGQNYYLCDDRYVIGGYNTLGIPGISTTINESLTRVYTGLKAHNIIYYSYTLSQYDQWNPNDFYSIQFDSTIIKSLWFSSWVEWSPPTYVCGLFTYPDQVGSRIFGKVSHTDSSLKLSFIMNIRHASNRASAGFRDIRLTFAMVPQSAVPIATMCGISLGYQYSAQMCQCPEGQYADGSGTCNTCNSLCSSCFGPSNEECYWCVDGAEWTGTQCRNKPAFLTLVRHIQYTRYLNIYLPPRLRSFLDRPASNLLPINSEAMMPLSIRKKFAIQPIPSMFAEYNLHSNFLVNFWGELITLVVIGILGLLALCIERTQLKHLPPSQQMVVRQLCLFFKWNFPLALIAFNIDYIVLYASLQLYSLNLNAGSNAVGFIFCLLALILVPIFIVGLYRIVRLIVSNLRYQGTGIRNRSMYSSYYVFFGGYEQKDDLTKSFYPIYLARIGIPSIIACALYNFPQAQTALYVLINIFMLGFVVFKRPLIRKTSLVQLAFQETLSLMINICLAVLAAHDSPEWRDSASTVMLGDVVIVGNSLMNFVVIVFLIIKVAIETRRVWRPRKLWSYLKNGVWIRFAGIYVQQGAFGFEELFQERISYGDSNTMQVNQIVEIPLPTQPDERTSFVGRFKAMLKSKFSKSKPRGRLDSRPNQQATNEDQSNNNNNNQMPIYFISPFDLIKPQSQILDAPQPEEGRPEEPKQVQDSSFGQKSALDELDSSTQNIDAFRKALKQITSGKSKFNEEVESPFGLIGSNVPVLRSRQTHGRNNSRPSVPLHNESHDNSGFGFLEPGKETSFATEETAKLPSIPKGVDLSFESPDLVHSGRRKSQVADDEKNDTSGVMQLNEVAPNSARRDLGEQ